ncbi:MAG TPA: alpha-ketoglutarate-dependent dioxygenase AlkB [Allosphingosinicella sp.]|jgi:alkylated DNA repair dioxygenase AlkB|nr:alpha-ketoglutarate-dependent dioxygenase AlkB [Allosphingosinicella sp.]
MPRPQLNLFDDPAPPAPAGLIYEPGFIGAGEERALAGHIAGLPFKPFEFHGFTGNRRTVSFGLHYAFDGSGLREAEPIPDWLQPLRARAATLAGLAAEAFVHALVIEYAPGAGIGWHRDRPVFGDVVGISLLAPAPLRFRRRAGVRWERFTLAAEPRSAYLLRGEARHEWEHSIPPLETLRYSVTLRTLAK